MDTSPESSGKDVKPILHKNYNGQDIALPGNPNKVLRVSEQPELFQYKGKTLITTDGTTLLGSDDKSGIAVIMSAAEHLLKHPEIPHGPIRICFTCDEEIGKGPLHIDLKKLNADVGYTLDSEGSDCIDVETFSADVAIITIDGINIHPMIGKGKMVNAIRIAGEFLEKLPKQMAPEHTDGRDGFFHPYVMEGGVARVTIRTLLRDFEVENLEKQAALLEKIRAELSAKHPKAKISVEIKKQYRNLREGLKKEPRAVTFAEEAMKQVGLRPRKISIRAGTDGSQLTEMGLPTPNLSCGEHNPHSVLEWTCVEEMEQCRDMLVELAKTWAIQG